MPRSFPFYQQLDEMDCGATCIRMIARYFGRYYSLEYLRELTYIGKQGVSLLGISDAAEHIGLQSLAVKTTFDRLVSDIPVPCIAHWQQGHFVVIYRVNRKYVWIADPRAGKFKLTKEDFLKNFIDRWESQALDQIHLPMKERRQLCLSSQTLEGIRISGMIFLFFCITFYENRFTYYVWLQHKKSFV